MVEFVSGRGSAVVQLAALHFAETSEIVPQGNVPVVPFLRSTTARDSREQICVRCTLPVVEGGHEYARWAANNLLRLGFDYVDRCVSTHRPSRAGNGLVPVMGARERGKWCSTPEARRVRCRDPVSAVPAQDTSRLVESAEDLRIRFACRVRSFLEAGALEAQPWHFLHVPCASL